MFSDSSLRELPNIIRRVLRFVREINGEMSLIWLFERPSTSRLVSKLSAETSVIWFPLEKPPSSRWVKPVNEPSDETSVIRLEPR